MKELHEYSSDELKAALEKIEDRELAAEPIRLMEVANEIQTLLEKHKVDLVINEYRNSVYLTSRNHPSVEIELE
jgi:hypothetical protein